MHRLVAQLVRHEGTMLVAYQDTKSIWTIGIGHNMEADPEIKPPYEGQTITQERAELYLYFDLLTVVDEVNYNFRTAVQHCNFARRCVLYNMAFNMGCPRLSGFRLMFAAIRRSDWVTTKKEMLDSDWARDLPKRSNELAKQMFTDSFAL